MVQKTLWNLLSPLIGVAGVLLHMQTLRSPHAQTSAPASHHHVHTEEDSERIQLSPTGCEKKTENAEGV